MDRGELFQRLGVLSEAGTVVERLHALMYGAVLMHRPGYVDFCEIPEFGWPSSNDPPVEPVRTLTVLDFAKAVGRTWRRGIPEKTLYRFHRDNPKLPLNKAIDALDDLEPPKEKM